MIKMLRLDEQCTCPVCLDILCNPVVLSCSHNLCFTCAESLISQVIPMQSKSIRCPTCRSFTQISVPIGESLPRNSILQNLIEEWRKTTGFLSKHLCQVCSQSQAQYECIACELIQCQNCTQKHHKQPRYSHHKIISLSKLSQNLCAVHSIVLDLFCLTDTRLCCLQCVQESHSDHNVLCTDSARQHLYKEIPKCKKFINGLAQSLEDSKQALHQQLASIQDLERGHGVQLQDLRLKKLESINDSHLSSISQLKKRYEKIRTENFKKISNLELNLDSLSSIHQSPHDLHILQLSRDWQDLNPELLIRNKKHVNLEILDQRPDILQNYCQIQLEWRVKANSVYYLSRCSKEYLAFNVKTSHCSSHEIKTDQIIPRWSGFATLPNGHILVTGGKPDKESGAISSAFFLHPDTGRTSRAPNMCCGHSSHVVLRVDDRVYCMTGKNEQNLTQNFCEYYDLNQLVWKPIAEMLTGRTCAAGASVGKAVFVMGGYRGMVNESIERYDVAIDHWDLVQVNMPLGLWQHGCQALDQEQILIFGGEDPYEEVFTRSYVFNTRTHEFYGDAELPRSGVWLFFWLHTLGKGKYFYSMNKERSVLQYTLEENRWDLLDEL